MSDTWEEMTAKRKARAQRVAELTRLGWSAIAIAKELGVTSRTVIRDRVDTGTVKPTPRWLNAEELEQAEKLLADGCSVAEVERSLGRGPGTLATRFKGRGWPQGMTHEFLTVLRNNRNLDNGSDIWGGWLTSESERMT